jgi:thioredoxin reductase/NAD-dependent dihydropyrimidine dehydrogenase PreA subunit
MGTGGDTLLWVGSFAVVAAIVLPYALAFRRRRHADRERKVEAARLGIDRPPAQFPFVDPARCIGCGTCVDACPEGDVLGIVGGTATVVNGMRCVGHGRCEVACPVGAIRVGLGDLALRKDVPRLDEWHQTSVEGLFIIGELGGLALVKNAIAQARLAVGRVAQLAPRARSAGGKGTVDVVVVGAGPAGLAAAAAAREQRLSCVVLEQSADLGGTIYHYPRRKLVLLQPVDIPLCGRLREAEYPKEQLLEIFEELRRRASIDIRFDAKVERIEREGSDFRVTTTSGATAARFVILALGRRGTPRTLGVPGEDQPKVMYQLTDAVSYEGQRVLVVGGGDSAVEAAIGLSRQRGNHVSLSYRREKLVRIKKKNEERVAGLLSSGRIVGLFGSEVEEIGPASVRLRTPDGTREIPNDYVFIFAGGQPPFDLLHRAGVRFGGEGRAPHTG